MASTRKTDDEVNKRKRPVNRFTGSASRSPKKVPAIRSRTGRAILIPRRDGNDSSDEGVKPGAVSDAKVEMRSRHDAVLARLDRADVGIAIRSFKYGSSGGKNGELQVSAACEETFHFLLLDVHRRCLTPRRDQQCGLDNGAKLV